MARWSSRERYSASQWAPYVPVAARRATADKAMAARKKKGLPVEPVSVTGRAMATTFWGKQWCDALESMADFSNRLPRGKTYLRNGSVAHLGISKGRVEALVSGSSLYTVQVTVTPLPADRWRRLRESCAGRVGSLLELLQGKVSGEAMGALTHSKDGMIPRASELNAACSCPDGAYVCKHVAAVLYGVGARLDAKPDLLFVLRGVDMNELVAEAGRRVGARVASPQAIEASDEALADLFGIDLDGAVTAPKKAAPKKAVAPKKAAPKKPATPAAAPKKAPTPAREYTAGELKALGHTPGAVKKMLAEGKLERVSYGWYRFTA